MQETGKGCWKPVTVLVTAYRFLALLSSLTDRFLLEENLSNPMNIGPHGAGVIWERLRTIFYFWAEVIQWALIPGRPEKTHWCLRQRAGFSGQACLGVSRPGSPKGFRKRRKGDPGRQTVPGGDGAQEAESLRFSRRNVYISFLWSFSSSFWLNGSEKMP